MNRPLLIVAVAYVGGILIGDHLAVPLRFLFPLAFLATGVAIARAETRTWLLWVLVPLAGWTNMVSRTAVLSPHDLRLIVEAPFEYVTVRGVLLETPDQRIFEVEEKEMSRSLARLQLIELQRGTNRQPAHGKVAVTTPGEMPSGFFRGQQVEVTGIISIPSGPAAEGLFDYRSYLRRHGIHHQMRAESSNDWRIVPPAVTTPPLADRFRTWAQRVLARGLPGPDDEALRLLWAMGLGWKTALTDEVSEPFMRSGTMHIFAISGLHIALLAGILVHLLRVLRIPRAGCGLAVVPLIWFYTAATGWQPSAIRSTIMMSIVIGGWALRRPMDLLNSLAGAAFVILLWEPQQLFQASFQLSFFVVLSIALLLPPLERWRQRLLQPDPLLPPELRPRWQRRLDPPVRFLTTSLATSLAAWLGSLPLVAGYFHLFTPVSLLANVVVVPLSALALMSTLGSLACGAWSPALSELFNHGGWFWMECMVRASEWFASVPGAYRYVRSPTWLEFAIYYAVLAATLTGWLFAAGRRRWQMVAVFLAVLAWLAAWWPGRNEIRITVLPLRGGDAIHIDEPGSRNDLLIDCGELAGAERIVKPYLHAQGVNSLPALLLTHGDVLHIGGADMILEEFRPQLLLTGAVRFRSPVYRRLERSGRQRELERLDRVGRWSVLHPAREDRFAQADDSALVLRGELGGVRVLMVSDLGRNGQRKLMERERDLAADVVIAGMPNAREPLIDSLLDAIRPQVIVISAGRFPTSERATTALRERLGKRGVPVFFTSDAGAVTVAVRSGVCRVRSVNGSSILLKSSRGLHSIPVQPGG